MTHSSSADSNADSNIGSSERASRTRFKVLGALCVLSGILYLDRICISQALKPIKLELGLSDLEGSYIVMSFTLAYGLFEVPTGHWGDRIGARRVLTRISIWWSAFTALTGACLGLPSMIAVRFLFGAGEAGAFPNCARVLARWFPDQERGRAQGVMLTASQLGGVAAPTISAFLIEWVGWRWSFAILGSVGVVWAAAFWKWFRDDPAEHRSVNASELAIIGDRFPKSEHPAVPWHAVIRSRSMWILSLLMTCASFNAYVYFSWFATYMQDGRGVKNIESGLLTSLVLSGAAIGTMLGGVISDWYVRPRGVGARKLVGCGSFVISASCILLSTVWEAPLASAICAGFSCMASQATQPLWWASITAISGRHVGALFGLANSMGVFGALASQFFVGAFVAWRGKQGITGRPQWDAVFGVMAAVLFVGALSWASYTERPVEDAQH